MSSGSMRCLTTWMWMTSRSMETSIGLSTPSRLMVSVIFEFGAPRILSTASFSDRPCTVLPSSAGDDVARLDPGLEAGVSSIGLITLMKPLSWVTSMPRPPNSPLVCTCMSRNAFAFM